jgi:LysM repeat protein
MQWLVCPMAWLLWLSLPEAHVIEKGDTLYGISRRYGIAVADLVAANPDRLSEKSVLKIGQKIRLPLPAPPIDEVVRNPLAGESEPATASEAQLASHRPPPLAPPAGGLPKGKGGERAAQTYRVQRGDTLYKIARRFGMSVDQLRLQNTLVTDTLGVGQELSVVGRAGEKEPAAERRPRYWFITDVLGPLESAPVKPGRWKHIVVHHSGTASGNARIFDYFHKNIRGMENGMAYHFVIGNGRDSGDGEIEVGSRWAKQLQGGHLASEDLNEVALGICLVGDFNRSSPTKRQIAATIELISYLRQHGGGKPPTFHAHREINPKPTECPGKLFPASVFHELFE